MPKESNTWKWLAKARETLRPDRLMINRMENLVEVGRPDVDLIWMGITAQLELKAAKRPARPTTKLAWGSAVKDNQVEWHEQRLLCGGSTGWLLQVGEGAWRKIYLIPGRLGRVLQAGVTEAWCAEHNVLVNCTPEEVVRRSVMLTSTYGVKR